MKAELVYRVTLIFVHIVKHSYTNNSTLVLGLEIVMEP